MPEVPETRFTRPLKAADDLRPIDIELASPLGRNDANRAGEFLFHQAERGTSVAVILDGNFEVQVNGKWWNESVPGQSRVSVHRSTAAGAPPIYVPSPGGRSGIRIAQR
jgi:hypothetical protein